MKRGDLVTLALQGDCGEPRLAVMIQSDLFEELASITVLPLTGELRDTPLFRITIEPSQENGLHQRSQIMIDKIQTIPKAEVGASVGSLSEDEQVSVNRSLMLFLGLG